MEEKVGLEIWKGKENDRGKIRKKKRETAKK